MNKRFRSLLLGCGSMSPTWLETITRHFSDRVEMVALCDLNHDAARKRADEFRLADAWTGSFLQEALTKTRPEIIFNCTIPEAHAETCEMALKAGCHVLVEKPLASTLFEARKLCEISAKSGKLLAVIQNRRYLAAGEAVRKALAENRIGAIHTVCADFFLAPRFGGFREKMKHPLLVDMAIHTFDQARYLTGLDATSVYCHEFNPLGSWFAHGASASAIFEMSNNAVFTYRGSWCARGAPTSWESQWRIIGEKGTLTWNGRDSIALEQIAPEPAPLKDNLFETLETEKIEIHSLPPSRTGHAGNIHEFLDSIETNQIPQTVASDNILSLAMVLSATESATKGKVVKVNPHNS